MMIVPDDQRMGFKMADEKFTDVILSGKPGKGFGKRNDHQAVDPFGRQQLDFFIQRIDHPDRGGGLDNGSGMRIECNDDCLSLHFGSPSFHLGKHLLVAGMHSVKGSDRDHGILKEGKKLGIPVNLHN
jgi:hypothetical protein